MKINKSVILIAVTITVLTLGTTFFLLETQAGEISIAAPFRETLYSTSIDDRFIDDARFVTVQKGTSIKIPVSINAPMEKSLNVKAGITLDGYEGILVTTGKSNLPEGVSAVLDKTTFALASTKALGINQRDTVNLTLQVDKNTKSGNYPLSLVLYEQNGDTISDVREYFTLIIE